MIPLNNTHARRTSRTNIPIAIPTSTIANITHMQDTTTPGMYIRFLHQSLGSPYPATLLHALATNDELQTIPGLNAAVIRKYLQHSPATDKGHLHRVRQNVASTHNNQHAIIAERTLVDNLTPDEELCVVYNVYCYSILAGDNPGTMYTDLTGCVPRPIVPQQSIRVGCLRLRHQRHTGSSNAFQNGCRHDN